MSLRILQQRKNFLLDGDLMRVRQFVAIAGKNFDAIVGPRIMRRRNHHARRILPRARQISHARRCNHTRAMDFNSTGGQSVRDAVGDPCARFARVLPNHDAVRFLRNVSDHGPGRGQSCKCCPGSGEIRRQRRESHRFQRAVAFGMSYWIATASAAAVPAGTFSIITVTRTGLGFITCTKGSET